VKVAMDNVIPRIERITIKIENVDSYSDDFQDWSRSVTSNGSRTDEQMSKTGRHLLKAVATLGRCDGLSSRSAKILVENGNDENSKYSCEEAARKWSTVVDISIALPSFKHVLLSLSHSPLSKTPKQVFFNPINILTLFNSIY